MELRAANDLAKNTQSNVNRMAQNYDERPSDYYLNRDGPQDRYKKDDFEVQLSVMKGSPSRGNLSNRGSSMQLPQTKKQVRNNFAGNSSKANVSPHKAPE